MATEKNPNEMEFQKGRYQEQIKGTKWAWRRERKSERGGRSE